MKVFKKALCSVMAAALCTQTYILGAHPLIGNIDTVSAETAIQGDISGNGKIDLTDAVIIAKFLLNPKTLDSQQQIIADYNGSGKVDLQDAVGIAKYLLMKSGTETQHVHTWKNVYETVDVYEEQPVYEEVPVYEEITEMETHVIVNDTYSGNMGFDMTVAYREYVASGGTKPMMDWALTTLKYEMGIEWWATINKDIPVTKTVQVGTEMKQTGTKKVKTAKQQYDHKVCISCGVES